MCFERERERERERDGDSSAVVMTTVTEIIQKMIKKITPVMVLFVEPVVVFGGRTVCECEVVVVVVAVAQHEWRDRVFIPIHGG